MGKGGDKGEGRVPGNEKCGRRGDGGQVTGGMEKSGWRGRGGSRVGVGRE